MRLSTSIGKSIETLSINQFCEDQESASFLNTMKTNVNRYILELSLPSDLHSGIKLYNILDYEIVGEIYEHQYLDQ